jgi:hypothetical protein
VKVAKAQMEGKEPLPPFPSKDPAANHYYPPTPIHIGLAVAEAGAEPALLLILAAHRQMCMRARRSIALTSSIWRAAGLPDDQDQRRRTVLANLRKIPGVLTLTEKRSRDAHYQVAYGPLWKRKPRLGIDGDDISVTRAEAERWQRWVDQRPA